MATVTATSPSLGATPGVAGGVGVGSSNASANNPIPNSAQQPYASASLYVGDLNSDVTEALLFEIFNAVGPVASVRVCRDAATRRSLGYAYVNFHRMEDAERALDTLNFKMIRNRACRIMWSHRDPSLRRSGLGNIFINHLAKDIDNKQLYDTFSTFGNILSCKVATNSKRESLGYGFVHYETEESALTAIARVDGKVIKGEKVSVQKFVSKKERPSAQQKNNYTNVFVKNLPLDFTKEQLDEIFGQFGTITSSTINVPEKKDDKTRAFGFINFATADEANAAVEGGNNIELAGKKLFVGRAQKKEERAKELADRFENLKLERAKKYAGVNLFVKNLADDIDDERLTTEFVKFGQITSAKVMRENTTAKSRGFGFVCFSTPEEATKAVTEMNGKMLEGKPLYVALAQRKEQRRAQLEAQYAARQKLGGPGLQGVPGLPMGYPGAMGGMPGMMAFGGMPGGMPQQRNFMYPQQVMPNGIRWNPQQNPMMGMVGGQIRPGQQMNYQLMPAQALNARGVGAGPQIPGVNGVGARGPRGAQQAGAGGRPGAGGPGAAGGRPGVVPPGGKPMQGMVPGPQGGVQNIRYNENVRNQNARGPQAQGGVMPQQQSIPIPGPNEALTPSALAAAPDDMRKQMIGERLFPLIHHQEPELAGKITGMLLEMDNTELLHLLEARDALSDKIQEALQVLHTHGSDDAGDLQD